MTANSKTHQDLHGQPGITAGPILVSGVAGFIGFHVACRLLREGVSVIGVDNVNDYYEVSLKESRLRILMEIPGFIFQRLDLGNAPGLTQVFASHAPKLVIHLAAQAGVRYSLTNPHVYAQSNLVGFLNILEACRQGRVAHLIYASSSSVYGANSSLPYHEEEKTDHPVSLYGATKKSNELMAHAYSHLFGFPCTGLRFFTVYGPWSRPDMAMFKFTKAILGDQSIDLYNNGRMMRDFTYIDDVVEGVVRVLWHHARPLGETGTMREPAAQHRVYNIGNHSPVNLLEFVQLLERVLQRKALINLLPLQDGDVLGTFADISALQREVGFAPHTPLEVGVPRFVAWYREYYRV